MKRRRDVNVKRAVKYTNKNKNKTDELDSFPQLLKLTPRNLPQQNHQTHSNKRHENIGGNCTTPLDLILAKKKKKKLPYFHLKCVLVLV